MNNKFTTKAYTLSSLIKEISSLSSRDLQNVEVLARAISPRAGVKSAKFAALNRFLGNKGAVSTLLGGTNSNSGSLNKRILLNALKFRKNS